MQLATSGKRRSGFSLIDLMVTVAILGILAAIAIPMYGNFIVRTRVSEGILAASQCRTVVAERYQTGSPSTAPGANEWGCEVTSGPATKFVDTITTDPNGVIMVWLAMNYELKGAAHHTITLTPVTAQGVPLTAADMPAQVGHFRCQAGGLLPIPTRYLPGSCR
jgi:type IV pilus assembly protein PilA